VIETERLLLRKPRPDDVAAAAELLRDPAVMRWLGGVEVDADAVAVVVQRWIDDWQTYPAGKLVVERLEDGAFVGRVGVNFYDPGTWRRSAAADAQPELTWALVRRFWGYGYATEAARAMRDWHGGRLISLIAPANVRSQRLAERLGATPGETVELQDHGPHVVWEHPR
jgi:RimJ/RimL family protein N-acetyltransferase